MGMALRCMLGFRGRVSAVVAVLAPWCVALRRLFAAFQRFAPVLTWHRSLAVGVLLLLYSTGETIIADFQHRRPT